MLFRSFFLFVLLSVSLFASVPFVFSTSVHVSVSVRRPSYSHVPAVAPHMVVDDADSTDAEAPQVGASPTPIVGASPIVAKGLTHVYMMRGLGGRVTSGGVDAQDSTWAAKYPKEHVVVHPVYDYTEWRTIAQSIISERAKTPDAKFVITGYSMGANAVTLIASEPKVGNIDLLVSYDPTVWWTLNPLENNVKSAICFHNHWLPNVVGLAKLSLGTSFDPKNYNEVQISEAHGSVDYDPKLAKIATDALEKVIQA